MSVLSPSVVESFVHIRLINCTAIAAVTVLIWDYLILLPDEVALVWPTSWNISKYLFLLNRYLAFVDPIMLIYVVMFGDDEKVCVHMFRTLLFLSAIGFILGQCILILRAYAVWGKQFNRLYAVIFGIYLGSFGVSLWTVAKYVGGVYSTGAPALGMTGCTLFFKNRFGWFDVALFLGAEFISALLMVIKAIQHFRDSRSSLMATIYRDGLLYFAYTLALTIAELVVMVWAPLEINELMVMVQRVLQSVLCSRVLLHIRSAHGAQIRRTIGDSLPTMVMAQFTEPLHDSLWPSDQPESQNGVRDYSTFDDEIMHEYPPGS